MAVDVEFEQWKFADDRIKHIEKLVITSLTILCLVLTIAFRPSGSQEFDIRTLLVGTAMASLIATIYLHLITILLSAGENIARIEAESVRFNAFQFHIGYSLPMSWMTYLALTLAPYLVVSILCVWCVQESVEGSTARILSSILAAAHIGINGTIALWTCLRFLKLVYKFACHPNLNHQACDSTHSNLDEQFGSESVLDAEPDFNTVVPANPR
ncbi:hypothetical protein [Roseiconus lacunae]|uniref:Yip1 domain-containing protein n=1 Tax=Roseiconus lacunae TaxID=2605694 RepID=A0ABT7PHR0_9BACT|nr:hypothetical protein [Roseiconus lacunae]MDM4015829.1 hypothetical protein [Roseiconus lacunae]